MTDVIAGSWRMIVTAWRLDWRKTVYAVILMLAGAAAGPMLAVVLGWMANEVVAGDWRDAAVAGVAAAVLAIMALTFAHFAHLAHFELSELTEVDFDQQLLTLSNGSAGIAHHEQAEHADALTVLQRDANKFRFCLDALLNCVSLGLAGVLTGVLLVLVNPVLLLLPLAALPPLLSGRWAERILDRAKTASAEPTRVAQNLFRTCTSARSAGELRVFRLQREFQRRHAEHWAVATRRLWRAQLLAAWVRTLGQVAFALAYVGAVLLVVRDAIAGRRDIGDVVLLIALAAQVNQQVVTAVGLLQDLQQLASAYRRLDQVRALVADPGALEARHPMPDQLRDGIELSGVSFTYPGAQTPVLRNVSLRLPAGATVAFVGENGAGKTTLINLLCGFYRPSAGQILLDGVDLAELGVEEWRGRIAAGFQDFVQYEFQARRTVGVGDLPHLDSEPHVRAALDRAHGNAVLDALPEGLATQLGKSYAEGVELSGGQWQRLALGRALMRPAPLLRLLDEPTSALDPQTEHDLFERYAELARQSAAQTGAITILVSHRFSTVRMADLIIVVRDGEIVKIGNHNALMADDGLYAELFSLQAKAYR